MGVLRFTILGCGSSGGVPRLGGVWGACDPKEPKNVRRRCSMLVERFEGDEATRVLIDAGPDMRQQLLDAEVGHLDAVLFTHEHADHMHGLDDLRMIVINRFHTMPKGEARLPVYATPETQTALIARFGYAFVQPEGSPYPPILDLKTIDGPLTINGLGGPVEALPFTVDHGSIDSLGFRMGPLAYLPDVVNMSDEAWSAVDGVDTWVVDALRYTPHPTHSHLEQTLDWIARAAPRQGILTNMHTDLDYGTVMIETPDNVVPAYDGMTLTFDI